MSQTFLNPAEDWQPLYPTAKIEMDHLISLRFDPVNNLWVTPDPQGLESEIEGKLPAVLVWQTWEGYQVYDQHCPHQGVKIDPIPFGTKLVCRMHRWTFDLEDGDCLNNTRNLTSYPTKVEGGMLWVNLQLDIPQIARLNAEILRRQSQGCAGV